MLKEVFLLCLWHDLICSKFHQTNSRLQSMSSLSCLCMCCLCGMRLCLQGLCLLHDSGLCRSLCLYLCLDLGHLGYMGCVNRLCGLLRLCLSCLSCLGCLGGLKPSRAKSGPSRRAEKLPEVMCLEPWQSVQTC